MVKINMLSRNFAHDKGSTANKPPVHIEWAFNSYDHPISVYLDNDAMRGVQDKSNGKPSFLWLIESRKFDGGAIDTIKNNLDAIVNTYEQIWTHNQELLSLHPKFKWAPAYGSYITDFGVHPKTKLASMIVSDKRWTRQHEIRHDFAMANKDKIDVYGRGTREIPKKEEGLKDYMFSIVVENSIYPKYYTEKITDCFATGTVPIYYGDKSIGEDFNTQGIIFIDDMETFDVFTPELYQECLPYVKENYDRVNNLTTADDFIYKSVMND